MSPRIAIIGAGVGGLALGVKLKKAGIESFTIFEASDGPGGTWWDNTYPGAACDVNSIFYSFSFMPWDWTQTHASQPELLTYIKAVIETFDLHSHLRLGTPVSEAVWDEASHSYTLRTGTGETHVFDVVVSAVGMLNVPKYPAWPGLDSFQRPKFHTARWEHQHDLKGRRVAVVGGGSSTAQVVPAIAPLVERLYLFQREAGWVTPKGDRTYSQAERERYQRNPLLRRLDRLKIFWSFEKLRSASDPTSANQRNLRTACLELLERSIPDPALRDKVTPSHAIFCKRPILSSDYLPALVRSNVEVVPLEVTSVTPTGVVDSAGVEREIDVLIMATGFRAADYLSTLDIRGREGKSLHQTWGGEPSAFLGLATPGFPNFYMLYGPGTNGGSIIFKLECQADWVVKVIKRMRGTKATAVEVKTSAYERFNQWLDRNNAKLAWRGGCNNYFASPSGRIVTQWPGSMTLYWMMSKAFNRLATTDRRSPARRRAASAPPEAPSPEAEVGKSPELVVARR